MLVAVNMSSIQLGLVRRSFSSLLKDFHIFDTRNCFIIRAAASSSSLHHLGATSGGLLSQMSSSEAAPSSHHSTTTTTTTSSSSAGARLDLSGIFPPIATPFDDNENVDYDKLDFNLRRWNDLPFKGRL